MEDKDAGYAIGGDGVALGGGSAENYLASVLAAGAIDNPYKSATFRYNCLNLAAKLAENGKIMPGEVIGYAANFAEYVENGGKEDAV